MFQLIYTTSATELFPKDALQSLLTTCRENNTRLNITGMLLYKNGCFLQALEGSEDAVKALYAKIILDPRQKGALLLWQAPVAEREFADWSMGFRNLDLASSDEIPGYSQLMNVEIHDIAKEPSRAKKLLQIFRKTP